MSEKIIKGRDWAFVVYPESAPENWREILDETRMRWIESPLHDKDFNPGCLALAKLLCLATSPIDQ